MTPDVLRPATLTGGDRGFKGINDVFGHPVGDEVLVSVAKRLITLCPLDTVLARPGGEFSILLPDADERSALALAQRAWGAIEAPGRAGCGY